MECAPCDNSILVKSFHHVDCSLVRALLFWRRLTGWERNLLVAHTARARNFFFAFSPPCQSNFLLVEGWALRSNEQRPSRTSAHRDIPNTRSVGSVRFSASSGTYVGMLLAMVGATC